MLLARTSAREGLCTTAEVISSALSVPHAGVGERCVLGHHFSTQDQVSRSAARRLPAHPGKQQGEGRYQSLILAHQAPYGCTKATDFLKM